MALIWLLAGVLLPWCVGAWILRFGLRLGGSEAAASCGALVMGYGFFVGYALVMPLMWFAYRFGGETAPLWLLGLLVPAGAALLPAYPLRFSRLSLGWWCLPALVIGLHLLFSLQQLLLNPILPWDAWSTWAYRAKVWYLAGDAYPFVAPQEWLGSADLDRYSLEAWQYPSLVSWVYLWTALTLGEWQEGLLGLPWWFAGVAVLAGVYGQARLAGLGRTQGLVLAWLLLAIPLFNVHIALQGYADLWLAGYAGLGMAALMSGLVRRERAMTLLGWGLLLLGLMVKREGLLWLLLALVVALSPWLLAKPQRWLGLLLLGLLLLVIGLAEMRLTLGWLGDWGYAEGRVYLGPLGAHGLAYRPVAGAMLRAMFLQGSWNLYWLLLVLLGYWAWGERDVRLRIRLLTLVLGYVALLCGLFMWTEHSQWMLEATAFNRVALHLAPAVLLALVHLRRFRRWAGAVA